MFFLLQGRSDITAGLFYFCHPWFFISFSILKYVHLCSFIIDGQRFLVYSPTFYDEYVARQVIQQRMWFLIDALRILEKIFVLGSLFYYKNIDTITFRWHHHYHLTIHYSFIKTITSQLEIIHWRGSLMDFEAGHFYRKWVISIINLDKLFQQNF